MSDNVDRAVAEAIARLHARPTDARFVVITETFSEWVDRFDLLTEWGALQAVGEHALAAEGIPVEFEAAHDRDPDTTRALIGFMALVAEADDYGNLPQRVH